MDESPVLDRGVLASPLRNLAAILSFVGVVWIAATCAYHSAGWGWDDAAYMVTLTLYTVGYGEVRPIDTPYLHLITMATMVLGCTAMILLTGVLVQIFTVMQLKQLLGIKRVKNQIEGLKDHVIVCGYGRIGVMLAKALSDARCDLVVVERDAVKLSQAEAAGLLTVAGDATEEMALEAAGVGRARLIATVLPDDAANVFITLTARSLNAAATIIARGEAPTTESKLLHAGADRVVLPMHIGAERIAEMILFPETEDFVRESEGIRSLKRGMSDFGLELEVVKAIPNGTMTGLSVIESERAGGGAFFIVQLDKADGRTIVRPAADELVEAEDQVVLVARAGRVSAGTRFSAPRPTVREGRGILR